MIHFAPPDQVVRQVADEAAARRETETSEHLRALYSAMQQRTRQAPRESLVEDLTVLALTARTCFPEGKISGDDDFHGTEARYVDLYKPRLVHEYLELAIWLRARAEGALRRLEVQAALSAHDDVGVPIFDEPGSWYRLPHQVRTILVVRFLQQVRRDEPRAIEE